MKGYIYLLKEKGHTNCHKIGRTNNLKRRLEQYNNGKTKVPTWVKEIEGDVEKPMRFNETPIEFQSKVIERYGVDCQIIKENKWIVMANRISKEYEFEYLHTVKVKDCIEAEDKLKSWVLDKDFGLVSEWVMTGDTEWIKSAMDEIAETINKRKWTYIKVPNNW